MIEKYSPPAGPHQRSTAKINLIIGDILKETKKISGTHGQNLRKSYYVVFMRFFHVKN